MMEKRPGEKRRQGRLESATVPAGANLVQQDGGRRGKQVLLLLLQNR
jgi:hypothetical protein